MEKFRFNSIRDVILAIEKKNYNKNFASIMGASYTLDESKIGNFYFNFNESKLKKYSFFFYFLDIELINFSNESFKEMIKKLVLLDSEKISPLEIKEILFEKEINLLRSKYESKIISYEIYKSQMEKYLS